MIEYNEILLRLILAAVFGGLIGIEREIVHKPAGVRTHMLVSLGSALFILLALENTPDGIDKIIAGVATGVGFLGAGTIFKSKIEVHGLTTAASIWAVAGVGLGLGLGYYFITLVSVVLVLIILHLNKLEFFRNL
ncbi:MAG TPA: MgtC/SapB family protein [Candidatus Nanoarchaeia archaeon]|nr:MgtC/SapB family protein [Candidatus Nanoarchaeia archaeon]